MEKHHGRHKDQASHHRVYAINGEVKFLAEWCKIYNAKPTTVRRRVDSGMTLLDALTAPPAPPDKRQAKKQVREISQKKIYAKCKKCRWSEWDDARPICMYLVNHQPPQRRPVSVEDCVQEKPGSVFERRKRGRLTPAQMAMFTDGRTQWT